MHLRFSLSILLLAACPPAESTSDASTGATAPGSGSDTSAATDDVPTTGDTTGAGVQCVDGGIGPAFAWSSPPDPGTAKCSRISDDNLAFDCTGDFTGIFTLTLANTGKLGITTGAAVDITYRTTQDGDLVTGEWLQVRDLTQRYIIAGQGPTLAPPDAPADWFHPNVEVSLAATDCAANPCMDGSGDASTPGAIAFGQGDLVSALAPGKDGGVPGEFGGESYHAAVTEAHTGLCGAGAGGADVAVLAYSVVSSGFL